MSEDNSVLVDREGAVTIVTINRPQVRNAVDAPPRENSMTPSSPLMPTRRPRSRCSPAPAAISVPARASRKSPPAIPRRSASLAGSTPSRRWGRRRLRLTKPVIAAVEGFAVAGGMELALWADMRVVAEDATFGIFCRRFGVPLIDLGTIRLPRLIGHSQAIDLILTGRPVGAQEALRMGLANRVVARGEASAHAIALAQEIARFPQTCMRADRASALRQWDLSEEEAIANEMRGGLEVIASGETFSGAARFASGVGRHGAVQPRLAPKPNSPQISACGRAAVVYQYRQVKA